MNPSTVACGITVNKSLPYVLAKAECTARGARIPSVLDKNEQTELLKMKVAVE